MMIVNMQQHYNHQGLSWHAFIRAINLYATNSFKKPDLASSMILIEHHRKSSTFVILDLLLTQATNLEMKKLSFSQMIHILVSNVYNNLNQGCLELSIPYSQ